MAVNIFLALLGLLIFFFGACIFSFLNVIVYRVPKHLNFISGHSFCPGCRHELTLLDMIPLISYLCLGGKCRYCHAHVGIRDTLVETGGGLMALICVWKYQAAGPALTAFALIGVLTVVALMDMDTMEIEDGCHMAVLVIAVISYFTMPGTGIASRLIGVFCISLPMILVDIAVPGGFGGGDIKLMAACGLFFGWQQTLLGAFVGFVSGGIYGAYLLAAGKKDRKAHFAFGPFLCFGMVTALFAGQPLLHWYMGLFGL